MTPETAQWRRVKELFLEAVDRPDEDRHAFVAEACAGDDELKKQVESLLDNDCAADSFCETPAAALLGELPFGAPDPPRLRAGARLGPYEITAFVAAGGMGEVYRARDTVLGRDVAIKTVGTALVGNSARSRLLKEAQHASTLSHPNICTIYEVGEADDLPYIAMEFAEGHTLSAICRGQPLPPDQVIGYALQIADALAHAHERSIVHRDLKSSNVVIDRHGTVTVLDFGLSKRLPDANGVRTVESFSANYSLAGTLSYMAPEVLLGHAADERSDVWALGVLLYEMANGQLPFAGSTPFETSSAILGEPPRPMPRRIPLPLRAVIERCLTKDPAQRWRGALDVRAALVQIRERPWRSWLVAGRLAVPRRVILKGAAAVAVSAALLASASGRLRQAGGRPLDPQPKTLAVLPLDNATGDDSAAYYAAGLTDALVAEIGALRDVRVIARGSTARFSGSKSTPAEIGAALGAHALVQGALRMASNRIQLDVRLIDAATARVLWSKRFERSAREILALQAEVVRALADGVEVELQPEARKRLTAVRAVSPDVYEAYLKGRYFWNQRTPSSIEEAIALFDRAVQLDPTYAPAHAALADCFNQQATVMVATGSPPQLRAKAAAAAIRALQIDQSSSEAHAALGYVRHYDWQWDEAEREFVRAIELNPSNPLARIWYANMLMSRKRMDEAIRQVFIARTLDPFSLVVNANVGWVLVYARKPQEAIDQLRRTLELDPSYSQARFRLVKALLLEHRNREAAEEAERVVRGGNRSPSALSVLAVASAHAGRLDEARQLLRTLLDLKSRQYVPPGSIADIYVALSELDLAFPWMEKAFEERSNWVAYIAGDPANDALFGDPRFKSLLARSGLD